MDEEKGKEITFKPSKWLYIFLFIYYSIWLLQSYGSVGYYIRFGVEGVDRLGWLDWLSNGLTIIAGLYTFYAVIKTLRGDRDCITALKWSLVVVFFYTLVNQLGRPMITDSFRTFCVARALKPAFYLVFYLYLCFAKGIKRRYPKAERRFAPSGWVWIGITICFVGICGYFAWMNIQKSEYCRRVNVAGLTLGPGEVCDGYVLFSSDREWQEWTEPEDTLYFGDRLGILRTMVSADSLSYRYIASGRCDRPDQRIYNRVIAACISEEESKATGGCSGRYRELSFTDTVIAGKRLMSTIFETTVDSATVHYNVAMVAEANGPKCCILLYKDRSPIDPNLAVRFAGNLQFDLQKFLKGEDNIHRDTTENKQSGRITQCKYQSHDNMHSTLFDCFPPTHLLGIMTLKNHKGEIAYREYESVF